MKKILFSFLVLQIISALNLYGQQSGWVWQNPLPQGNLITDIKIFDSNTCVFLNRYNLLKTTDGGASWKQYNTGFYPYNQSISAVNENLIFMLVDSTVLIKSTDKGITWKYICDKKEIENSEIYFLNSQTGFALNKKSNDNWYSMAIRKTTDGGRNWSMSVSSDSIVINKLFFVNEQTGFAGGVRYLPNLSYKTKIYKTTNSGLSWDSLKNDLLISVIGLYFLNENTGLITGKIYNGSSIIYKTTNGGQNWNSISGLSGAYVTQIKFFDDQNGLMLSSDKMYTTTNGGLNWQYRYFLLNGSVKYMNLMGFINPNTGYVSGSFSEILKTTNAGSNWIKIAGENVYNPQGNQYLWDIRFGNSMTGFAAGDNGKILRTSNGGANWELLQLNPNLNFESIAYAENTYYVSEWSEGKILKTSNIGQTWDTTDANAYGITELQFINANTGFGVCKYSNFIKTTNGGAHWIVTEPFGSQNWALNFIDENTGFAGGSRIYKTINGGASWDTVTFGNNLHYYAESINFINNSTGFIAGNNIILKTTNCGTNWEKVHEKSSGYFYEIQFVSNQTGFAISSSNFYKSTDGGNSWKHVPICTGFYNNLTTMFFTDPMNGWIAGSGGIIIRTSNGGEPIFVEPPVEIPTTFYLFQNYPNPFNPTTTIRYGLPKKVYVKLKIYDILGRLVKELYNGEQEAGNHSIIFDGSAYASGVYFCTLETPEFTQSQKMVLLK